MTFQQEHHGDNRVGPAGDQWFQAIVEAWGGLIYVGGPDFRIRYLNRRFIEAIGRDATGESCYQALHGRGAPCPWCPREVFAGKSVSGIFRNPLDSRWYQVTSSPLPLADGTFAKVAFIRESPEPDTLVQDLPVFRNIVDRLSDAILFHAPDDGRIVYANDAACQNLGHDRDTLLGMWPWDYADASFATGTWRDLLAAVEKEEVAVFEARYRHRDGTARDVEVKATRIRAGLEDLVVTVARDITSRKQIEARLLEKRNKLEAIMAATGDGITVQDLDFRIIYQNEVLIRRRGDRRGEPCYRVYANRESICEDCQAQKSIADGRVYSRPFSTTTPDGRPLHLEISAHPLRDARDEISACVEVVRDVTEQRKLEMSREEAFSAVSHEMRTPLTAVLGFSQFLLENPTSPEKQKEYLGLVVKEGGRLKRLIDNLLSLHRLRAGFGLVNPAPVLLYPLLREVAEHYRPPVISQRIAIDCSRDLPAVLGETVRIHEAVMNLLDNAAKYSPARSRITLGAGTDHGNALLWVRDEGRGIPEDQREKIFERFYRLKGSGRLEGTGLGLALVREIAHAHGGRAWVESGSGQGCTFYLILPFASASFP